MDLDRFTTAQDQHDTYQQALRELRAGQKTSHWMWFVFPQLAGLGRSSTAQFYGIAGLSEARAYLDHPVLGARLRECVAALLHLQTRDAVAVLGAIDAMKLRSCLTLFDVVEPQGIFAHALEQWCGGQRDPATLSLLGDASTLDR